MSILNKKIFDFTGTAIGLDLNDSAVRVVQFEREGKNEHLIGYGFSPVAQGCIDGGEILKKEQVILAIKNAIDKAVPKKLKSNKVICSLPESKAFLRIISIPKMNNEEAKEAIKWEIEANIPLTLEQVYYNWRILEKNITFEKNKMDVLVVAISKKIVDRLLETLEEAGLEAVGLEIESIAQARSLLGMNLNEKAVLIIDLNERWTGISISKKGVTCFTSSIPVSSQAMNNAISKTLNISIEDAVKTKSTYGVGSDFKNSHIFAAVRPVLENLALEIERSINFFLSELKYAKGVDEIILCGKEASTKGMATFLAQRLGRKVTLGNPWINVSLGKKLPGIERSLSIEYATAIGLALKGVNYEDIY